MAGNGTNRRQFAWEVEDKKRELMRRDPALSAVEAFRLAASDVSRRKPELLKAYRMDVRDI